MMAVGHISASSALMLEGSVQASYRGKTPASRRSLNSAHGRSRSLAKNMRNIHQNDTKQLREVESCSNYFSNESRPRPYDYSRMYGSNYSQSSRVAPIAAESLRRNSHKPNMHAELPNYMMIKPATEQSEKMMKRVPFNQDYVGSNYNNVKEALMRGKSFVDKRTEKIHVPNLTKLGPYFGAKKMSTDNSAISGPAADSGKSSIGQLSLIKRPGSVLMSGRAQSGQPITSNRSHNAYF